MNEFLKEDWAWFRKSRNPKCGDIFLRYTFKHKVRLFLGIHGQMPDGTYCFGNFDSFPKFSQRSLYKIMFYVGNPILNKILNKILK